MQDNYKFIDKNDFLEATNGGFDFFDYVMKRQEVKLEQQRANSNLINPFYDDKKGSMSIFEKNKIWFFNDFGNPIYSGDVFDFMAYFYGLHSDNDFQEILIRGCKYLGLNNLLIERKKTGIKAIIERQNYLDYELNFWSQYGITAEILKKFNVISINYIQLSKGNYKIFSNNKNPIFAYKFQDCYKIYQPFARDKRFKFQWLPSKTIEKPFGYEQLPEKDEMLIITSGEKDVLTLSSQRYTAICLNSETQIKIDDNILKEIKSRFSTIAVLYDLDETGEKSALALANQYDFQFIKLPMEMMEQKLGKDVSDYFKLVVSGANPELFSVERFRELVEKSISTKQKLNALPDLKYSNLPDFFQDLLSKFDSKQERNLILLSSLAVLSACIPNYYAIYNNLIIYPNLYLFVVGNPASGKGIIQFSRKLVEPLDNEIFEADRQIEELKSQDSETKKISCPQKIILPGNTSSSGFFELLHRNNGNGLLFENEADTLSYIFKKDYGDYSDGFRKAFHHEEISFYRRTQKEYICIQKPKLSVVLSGTPAQVFTLIQNNEDGLFSRFIFFLLNQKTEFKDVFATEVPDQ